MELWTRYPAQSRRTVHALLRRGKSEVLFTDRDDRLLMYSMCAVFARLMSARRHRLCWHVKSPFDFEDIVIVWADLPKLLALAQYENVRMKISGASTMSHQPFPYDDIWEPVLRVIDAFGLDRCMWGTDWTRTIGMLTYEQGVAPFRDTKRLSENDKATLMGGTLQKVYKW